MVLLINKWLLSLFLLTNVHPYHVSATEMEYDAKTKRIEISTKIFTDDFENVLNKLYKQKVDLSDRSVRPQMTALIKKYISTHLSVKSDQKILPLQLYGWEIDHEAVYVYSIANAPSFNPQKINVQKTVLYDLFDDQVNIIHFIYNGKRKSNKLVYPDKEVNVSF
ncbi:DUF6702 family protein [Niabella ginsengisoli]|uniref:DUF3828 domain-containing protein n=1 Tax=Niabella ginsengisoli TaxID=522298 RepID=A0ABS9SDS9_9BACT|nr:DUF6702 family protein [Niabella ginsengisoli]MCH5596514.1 hypothetical protein [Niabella ginsengisoli]